MPEQFIRKMKKTIHPRLSDWMRRILIAGSLAIAIQLVFVYIKFGNIFRVYHITSAIELTYTFFYFLTLFWIYPKISHWISSSFTSRFNSIVVNIIEGVTVVISTFLLTAIVKVAPMWITMVYFNSQNEALNMQFDLEAMRKSLIIHAVLGLLFYYFVERERLRKELQAEHLRFAKLQREEFRNQLEKLKNQVSPKFLFQSLNTLDGLIGSKPEDAVNFVNQLSSVYRSFLDHEEEVVTLGRELEIVEAYTSLIKAGLGEKVKLNIQTTPEYLDWQLPYGSLQSIIENAFVDRETTPNHQLFLSIYTSGNKLILQIAQQQDQRYLSVKKILNNLNERYSYLTDQKIKVKDNGTELHIEIPLLRIEEYSSDSEQDF